MNEQIKKWLKNHLVNSEYTEFGWQECHRYEFDEDEIKEFTKLIVKECAKVASDYDGAHYVGTAIEQHFGVEE
jgi:hypothetical protein